jgi:hypothetical protein
LAKPVAIKADCPQRWKAAILRVIESAMMGDDQFPVWFFWLSLIWIVFLVLLSVVIRKARDKPIVPKVPQNALYAERSASGGMASNCLIVAVTPDALVVTPRFPFNLMFLPEIYGMEHNVPRSTITQVSAARSWGSNVTISRREGRDLKLKVRDPAGFVAALEASKLRETHTRHFCAGQPSRP